MIVSPSWLLEHDVDQAGCSQRSPMIASFQLYREAIPRLFRPQDAEYDNLSLALGVIVGSMLVAAIPLAGLFMQKTRGAAAKAQLMELVNDQFGLAAALVATILIPLGYPLADPIAAIAVATIIAVNALILFRDSASFLLGRSPGPEVASATRISRSGQRAYEDVVPARDRSRTIAQPHGRRVAYMGRRLTSRDRRPLPQLPHYPRSSVCQNPHR